MAAEFLTLDDLDVKGKRVLVRVDINCPVDPATTSVANDERIRVHAATTLRELRDRGAKVIVMSHQGSPGDDDFISLRGHRPLLEQRLGSPVRFVEDISGPRAIGEIARLRDGEVLLLENVRFDPEELAQLPADGSQPGLVSRLAPHIDCCVNDAFGAIHRSQPSLVGFGNAVPTAAGRVIERELVALDRAYRSGERPITYLLGGVKVKESLAVIRSLMASGRADAVLTGGLLGNLFLAAKGHELGTASWEALARKGIDSLLPAARELVQSSDKIHVPVDVAVDNHGREEVPVSRLPTAHLISDIGHDTVGRYSRLLEAAKVIIINSPMGRFEAPAFAYGTEVLLRKAADCKAFTVVGGGHSARMVSELGIGNRFSHVSSGGRATLYHLSGEQTPVVSMLRDACLKWNGIAQGQRR